MTSKQGLEHRHQVIARYVDAIHALGESTVEGRSLHDRMRVGKVDFWACSLLRESSPWRPGLFDRLETLRQCRRIKVQDQEPRSPRHLLRLRSLFYFLLSLFASLRNRSESIKGDVIFVVYFSAVGNEVVDRDLLERYFGRLPNLVAAMGLRPAVLFLPSDSPVVRMSGAERRTESHMQRTMVSPTLTAFAGPRAVVAAFRSWLGLQLATPQLRVIEESIANPSDLELIAPMLRADLLESLCGPASARVALLDASFEAALSRARDVRLLVYPFEGQGWEASLEAVSSRLKIPSIAYLHTIMKPWDVRAHTAMREARPSVLATHGPHDRYELQVTGSSSVPVEALRYEYLRPESNRIPLRISSGQLDTQLKLLIVLGSDCETSSQQLKGILSEIGTRTSRWSVMVKPHAQCPKDSSPHDAFSIFSGGIPEALRDSQAVFLCGIAAPLDSYLFGLPTAMLAGRQGYSMNPLEPDNTFFIGDTVGEVVDWLESAVGRVSAKPDPARFFDLNPDLVKWRELIGAVLSQSDS